MWLSANLCRMRAFLPYSPSHRAATLRVPASPVQLKGRVPVSHQFLVPRVATRGSSNAPTHFVGTREPLFLPILHAEGWATSPVSVVSTCPFRVVISFARNPSLMNAGRPGALFGASLGSPFWVTPPVTPGGAGGTPLQAGYPQHKGTDCNV